VTCANCGAELPADAKFCHACGAATTEALPPTEVIEPEPDPEPEPEPVDETQTGISRPALQAASVPTPPRERRARRSLEERGAFEEFASAITPLLRAPRLTGNLLAALVALALSILVAFVLWVLFDNGVDWIGETMIPPIARSGGDSAGIVSLFTFSMHQVPFAKHDAVDSSAPFLLVAVPLAACVAGLALARSVMPCSGRADGFWRRSWPFVLAYGVLGFLWSLVGGQGWHATHLRAFMYCVVIAAIAAWIYERLVARRPSDAAPDTPHERTSSRLRAALVVATRALGLMLVFGAVGWLVGSLVEAFSLDDAHTFDIAASLLNIVEGGFKSVAFGVLAEGDPYGASDLGARIWQFGDFLETAAFVVLLVTSLFVVLVGGLFSGFSIARRVRPRSRNDHALYGAVTGVVWAAAMLFAQFVVFIRQSSDGDVSTQLDGVQTFFFALLIGAILGALGGLLAASAYGERIAEAVDEVTPDVVD
jgi:hypothetical protein